MAQSDIQHQQGDEQVSARQNENVPAPGDLRAELRRVRRAMMECMKAGKNKEVAVYSAMQSILQSAIERAEYIIP